MKSKCGESGLVGAMVLCLSAVISGCGGDSSDNDSSNNDGGGGSDTGAFIDSEVTGLSYRTAPGGHEGKTNDDGEFSYAPGDEVTFYLGELEFPPVAAANVVTPLEYSEHFDINDDVVINIARLLQTLGECGQTDVDCSADGIQIPGAASLTPVSVEQSVSDFDAQLINENGNDVPELAGGLVEEQEAIDHLQSSIDNLIAEISLGDEYTVSLEESSGGCSVDNTIPESITPEQVDSITIGQDNTALSITIHDYFSDPVEDLELEGDIITQNRFSYSAIFTEEGIEVSIVGSGFIEDDGSITMTDEATMDGCSMTNTWSTAGARDTDDSGTSGSGDSESSGSGESDDSETSEPLIFEGSAIAENLPQEGGVNTDGLNVYCGHEYEDNEEVDFRVELYPTEEYFDYVLTFQDASEMTRLDGAYNSQTRELSRRSSASGSGGGDPDFSSQWMTDFDSTYDDGDGEIVGVLEETSKTTYTGGDDDITASCTSVLEFTLAAENE